MDVLKGGSFPREIMYLGRQYAFVLVIARGVSGDVWACNVEVFEKNVCKSIFVGVFLIG